MTHVTSIILLGLANGVESSSVINELHGIVSDDGDGKVMMNEK
jgi:hypothetical protein